MTILKESNEPTVPLKVEHKEEDVPKKSGVALDEFVITLRDGMSKINEDTKEDEWTEKQQKLSQILGEKNIVNFLAGVEICSIFMTKALQYKRKFVETHLVELLQPIFKK